MTEIKLYPDLVWVFAVFNLCARYFKGQTLFSWWWIVPIFVLEILLAGLMLKIIMIAKDGL